MEAHGGEILELFLRAVLQKKIGEALARGLAEALGQVIRVFLICFSSVSVLALVAFVFLERKRLKALKWWGALLATFAYIVVYLALSFSFLEVLDSLRIEGATVWVIVCAFTIVCLGVYVLVRRRLSESARRVRFLLLPLCTIFLSSTGVLLSLLLAKLILDVIP